MNSICSEENLVCADIKICSGWQGEIPTLLYKNSLGTHLILDFIDCNSTMMNDKNEICLLFNRAAVAAKCNVITECYHKFEPYGISGVTVISESHFTYHGWDEYCYAAIDLFYCGHNVEIKKAIEMLVNHFQPKQLNVLSIPRGYNDSFKKHLNRLT